MKIDDHSIDSIFELVNYAINSFTTFIESMLAGSIVN